MDNGLVVVLIWRAFARFCIQSYAPSIESCEIAAYANMVTGDLGFELSLGSASLMVSVQAIRQ